MKLCLIQQHPVDEQRIPAAILRWVILHDRLRRRGHEVLSIGPNTRWCFETRDFRGATQYLVPGPGTGLKSLDMLAFALLLVPTILRVRRRERPEAWFVDELFVAFGLLALRLRHPREAVLYDVMGVHYHQVRKHNQSPWRHLPLAWTYGLLEHLTLWASTLVSTVNETHRELLERWTSRPVRVVRDAAEFEEQEPADVPQKAPGEIWLTFVGKISNRRLDDLFQILPGLLAEEPRLRFVVLGNGPFFKRYVDWTARLSLADRVHFADFVPHAQLPAWLRHSDITYSDDWSDIGFPMKVFEYMALERAILVEDTPAVREVMRDGENCLLYHGLDGLRSGILRLASDPELRTRLGRTAGEEARRLHGWESRLDQFEALFREARQRAGGSQ